MIDYNGERYPYLGGKGIRTYEDTQKDAATLEKELIEKDERQPKWRSKKWWFCKDYEKAQYWEECPLWVHLTYPLIIGSWIIFAIAGTSVFGLGPWWSRLIWTIFILNQWTYLKLTYQFLRRKVFRKVKRWWNQKKKAKTPKNPKALPPKFEAESFYEQVEEHKQFIEEMRR